MGAGTGNFPSRPACSPSCPTHFVRSCYRPLTQPLGRATFCMAEGVPLALTKRKRFRAHYAAMTARDPNFRLQFLAADQGDLVLEDRLLAAVDAEDAAREAAFRGWPAGARVCRVTDLDGQEVASVARFV